MTLLHFDRAHGEIIWVRVQRRLARKIPGTNIYLRVLWRAPVKSASSHTLGLCCFACLDMISRTHYHSNCDTRKAQLVNTKGVPRCLSRLWVVLSNQVGWRPMGPLPDYLQPDCATHRLLSIFVKQQKLHREITQTLWPQGMCTTPSIIAVVVNIPKGSQGIKLFWRWRHWFQDFEYLE